ncbi:hypothetical protein [Aquimarina sp. AD10]|uniref:hypothetical protein n=1 Tax=Aquimarina sp. AD10 TaxID=1714849 RepID=UPI00131410F0|nr:hypothetical protein [Aquimarina sp. AD10]
MKLQSLNQEELNIINGGDLIGALREAGKLLKYVSLSHAALVGLGEGILDAIEENQQ